MALEVLNIHEDQFTMFTHINGMDTPYKMLNHTSVGTADSFGFQANFSSTISYPTEEVVDFMGTVTLKKLETWDAGGSPTIRYYYSTTGVEPSNFTQIGSDIVLGSFGSWNAQNVDIPNVRYLKRSMVTDQGRQFALRVTVDNKVVERTVNTTPAARTKRKLASSFGVNGFQWEPVALHGIFTSVRIFFNVEWVVQGDEMKYRFSPGYSGAVNLKEQVTYWNSIGVKVIFCIQNAPPFMTPNKVSSGWSKDAKGLIYGDDPYTLASWDRYAEVYRQFAIYMGNGGVSTSELRIDEGQPTYEPNIREANLNYNFALEVLGETDKWWQSGTATVEDRHYRTMVICKLLKNIYTKVKAVDPNVKVYLGGLAGVTDYYMKAISFWAIANNGGVLPFDGYNYHFYPSDGAYQDDPAGTRGVSPEAYDYYGKLNNLMLWRDKYFPNCEFLNTEYGYDTNRSDKRSQYAGLDIPGDEYIQGRWLLRIVFENWALNIDYMHLYWFADQPYVVNTGRDRFFMSGIIRSETATVPYEKKPAYYMYEVVANKILGTDYKVEKRYVQGSTYVLHCKDATTNKHLFWCWRGTENLTGTVTSQTFSDTLILDTPIPYGGVQSTGVVETGNIATVARGMTGSDITSLTLAINESPIFLEVTEGTVTVTVTASITAPTDGQHFNTTEAITVNVTAITSAGTISDVKFYIDNVLLHTDTGSPFTYTIPANTLTAGARVLKVIATNNTGQTDTKELTLNINEVISVYRGKKRGWF